MDRPKSRLAPAPIVATALCLVLAAYAVSYLAIVMPKRRAQSAVQLVDGRLMEFAFADEIWPEYRIGGPVSPWLFWPAHQLDRQIRRGTWTPDVQ